MQYKNAAGINLTSMIVQASSNERFLLDGILKSSKMPENQFYDYCNHFNLDINDDKWLNPTEEEAPPVGENEDIIFTDGSRSVWSVSLALDQVLPVHIQSSATVLRSTVLTEGSSYRPRRNPLPDLPVHFRTQGYTADTSRPVLSANHLRFP